MSTTPESSSPKLSIKFLVSNLFAGSLIGTGGNAIKELMEVSGARVNVSGPTEQFPGFTNRVVLVVGNESSISSASTLIWELLAILSKPKDESRTITWSPRASFSSLGSNDDAEVTMKLTVPSSAGGLILGRGGLTIRSIGETSGAKIQMTKKEDSIFTHERILTISGPLLACRKCTDLVVAKLAEDLEAAQYVNRGTTYSPSLRNMFGMNMMPRRTNNNNPQFRRSETAPPTATAPVNNNYGGSEAVNTTILMNVPDSMVGNILGRGGQTMREIMQLSGAKVVLSPREPGTTATSNRVVTITGSPICAQAAHMFCDQKLKQGANNPRRVGGKRE